MDPADRGQEDKVKLKRKAWCQYAMGAAVMALVPGCGGQPAKEAPTVASVPAVPVPIAAKPAPAPVVKSVAPKPVAVDPLADPNNILSKRSVYYDFDTYSVKAEFRPVVDAHATYLKDHPKAAVAVEGNADERGSREYNLALGQRRADGVKTMMLLLGASDRQIETVSFGEEKPKATGHDEAAWGQNRRSDIVYKRER